MPPGGAAFSLAASSTIGLGKADARLEDGSRGTTTGNSGPIAVFPGSILPGLEMNFRFAVFPRCEMGFFFPYLRLGGELRCAILDEKLHSPVSLAGSVALGYLPMRGGPWVRTGFDLSHRFKKVAPLFNVYLTYGPVGHALGLGGVPSDGGGGQGSWAWILRDELRLEMAVGLAIQTEGKRNFSADVFFGVAPHVVLYTRAPAIYECRNCLDGEVTAFREVFGISIVLGGEFQVIPPDGGTGYTLDPETRLKKTARALLAAGWGMFMTYGVGALVAIVSAASGAKYAWKLAVPLAGPFVLAATEVDYDEESTILFAGSRSHAPEGAILMAIGLSLWGVIQTAGLAMLITGHVLKARIKKKKAANVKVAPIAGPKGAGLALSAGF